MTYVLALLLGVLGIASIVSSARPTHRLELHDYGRAEESRFRDGVKGTVLMVLGTVTVGLALMFATGLDGVGFLVPLFLCVGMVMFPVILSGTYARAFLQRRLYGGYLPVYRKILLDEEAPELNTKLTAEDLRLSRWVPIGGGVIAATVGVLTFIIIESVVIWNGNGLSRLAIAGVFSAVLGFGVFMQVVMVATSRRIQTRQSESVKKDDPSKHTAA